MRLAASLAATAAFPPPEKLGAFAKHLPQAWIEQALEGDTLITSRCAQGERERCRIALGR